MLQISESRMTAGLHRLLKGNTEHILFVLFN